MLIDADLNEVKETEALPSNTYAGIILTEPKVIESAQKKTPGIEFPITLTDPGTELAPGVPRVIRHTVWKSRDFGWAHPGMKEVCEACGVPLDRPDTAMFVGCELNVALSQEPYTNKRGEAKVRNEVNYLLKKV